MKKTTKILFFDESFEGYATLCGVILTKTPVDMIVKTHARNRKKKFKFVSDHELNNWLKSKTYPGFTHSYSDVYATLKLTYLSLPESVVDFDFDIKGASLVEVSKDQFSFTNIQKQWGWNSKVLCSAVNLSDLPHQTKKEISALAA